MFYLLIEAVPAPGNTEAHDVGGAYVSCWIQFALEDGAEVLARYYLEQAGWSVKAILEQKQIERSAYQDDPENQQYYDEAAADGASFVFNEWAADAEDADVEYPNDE